MNRWTPIAYRWTSTREIITVGDGAKDDTSSIQNAIDSLTGGGTIIFPNGVYKTTAPIKLSRNFKLLGADPRGVVIKNENNTNIIETPDTTKRYDYLSIENITLEGVTAETQIGLNIPHVSFARFNNVFVRNCNIGIYTIARLEDGTVTGAYYNAFDNVSVTSCGTGVIFGITANENTWNGGKISQCDVGAVVDSNNVRIFAPTFESNNEINVKLTGLNIALYSPRVEGRTTAIGILNDLRKHRI